MTDAEYALTQERLLLVARMVSSMDLDGFLRRIEQAETAAPVLDPTLYARGGARLDAIRRIAEAAREFQRAVAGTEYHLRCHEAMEGR